MGITFIIVFIPAITVRIARPGFNKLLALSIRHRLHGACTGAVSSFTERILAYGLITNAIITTFRKVPRRIGPPEWIIEHVGIAIERLGIARSPWPTGLLLLLTTHLEPEGRVALAVEPADEAGLVEVYREQFDLHARHGAASGTRHHHIGADEARQGRVVQAGLIPQQAGVVALLAGVAFIGLRHAALNHLPPRVVRGGVDDRPSGVAHRAGAAKVIAVEVRHRPAAKIETPVAYRDGLAVGAVGQRVRVVAQPGAKLLLPHPAEVAVIAPLTVTIRAPSAS